MIIQTSFKFFINYTLTNSPKITAKKISNIGFFFNFNPTIQKTASNTNAFPSCVSLKEVRFVPNSIKVSIKFANSNLLSTDTIQSIIDGLATVSTAQTLTLHNKLKILQSQVDSANAKGWTVAGGTVVSEEEYYA